MARNKELSPEEREQIESLLRGGSTNTVVAKLTGRSAGLVRKVRDGMKWENGPISVYLPSANTDYDAENRKKLLNVFLEQAHSKLADMRNPFEFRSLVEAVCMLLEKRRLEEGLPPNGIILGQNTQIPQSFQVAVMVSGDAQTSMHNMPDVPELHEGGTPTSQMTVDMEEEAVKEDDWAEFDS